jgi:hypothetical protein
MLICHNKKKQGSTAYGKKNCLPKNLDCMYIVDIIISY